MIEKKDVYACNLAYFLVMLIFYGNMAVFSKYSIRDPVSWIVWIMTFSMFVMIIVNGISIGDDTYDENSDVVKSSLGFSSIVTILLAISLSLMVKNHGLKKDKETIGLLVFTLFGLLSIVPNSLYLSEM